MSPGFGTSILIDWIHLTRWGDWVQSKLPFLTSMAVLLAPAATTTWRLVAIVATVATGAAFGYGLNEVADRASDARAGKFNRAAGLGRRRWLPFLILTAAGALGFSLLWAPDAVAPVLVLLGLGLAMAYSVPPLRLKERGAAGLAGAAAAQWALPVLVVSAVQAGGWLRLSAWSFALMGLAIGTRWMVAHQLGDAISDRRSGVRTCASRPTDLRALLSGVFACELILLGIGLVAAWPRSSSAALALGAYLVLGLLIRPWHRSLAVRLAGYEQAPLGVYYFIALPVALAIGILVESAGSGAVCALLLLVALPQLLAKIAYWRAGGGSAVNLARASTQSPVVSASEPNP